MCPVAYPNGQGIQLRMRHPRTRSLVRAPRCISRQTTTRYVLVMLPGQRSTKTPYQVDRTLMALRRALQVRTSSCHWVCCHSPQAAVLAAALALATPAHALAAAALPAPTSVLASFLSHAVIRGRALLTALLATEPSSYALGMTGMFFS